MNMEQGQKIEYEQPELAKPKEATPEEPTKLESSRARAGSYTACRQTNLLTKDWHWCIISG